MQPRILFPPKLHKIPPFSLAASLAKLMLLKKSAAPPAGFLFEYTPSPRVEGGLPSYPPRNTKSPPLIILPPSPSPLSLSTLAASERERGEGVGGGRGGGIAGVYSDKGGILRGGGGIRVLSAGRSHA